MGIEDFTSDDVEPVNLDDEDSNDGDDTNTSDSETENQYEEYADLDDELDGQVAAIVDEILDEWNKDSMVDVQIHDEYVRAKRPDLVYGIVNIAKRTQIYFEEE